MTEDRHITVGDPRSRHGYMANVVGFGLSVTGVGIQSSVAGVVWKPYVGHGS